jgi:hypothetical protein
VIEKEWAKKCSVILLNEVAPRAKKVNRLPSKFWDTTLIAYLARLEYEGIITRRQLRQCLDLRVKELQENANIQES